MQLMTLQFVVSHAFEHLAVLELVKLMCKYAAPVVSNAAMQQ